MQDQKMIEKEIEALTRLVDGLADQKVRVMIVMVKQWREWALQKPFRDEPSKILASVAMRTG